MSRMTFDALRTANIHRLPEFKNKKGELAHPSPDGSDWTPLEWCGAASGELGELANIVKKVRRGDIALDDVVEDKGRRITVREWIAKEAADVVCYLDILLYQVDADLGNAVRIKFNEVSHDIGSTVRITEGEGHHIATPNMKLRREAQNAKIRAERGEGDPEPSCTGSLVHDEYTPCPKHDLARYRGGR